MTKTAFLRMMHAAYHILEGAPDTPGYVNVDMGGYEIDGEEHSRIEIHFGDKTVYEIRMDEKKEGGKDE